MPVASTEIVANYAGNGSTTTAYPITIPRARDEDLFLLVDGVATTNFSVSSDGFRTGVAYPNTSTLVLFRSTPVTQLQPFPSNTTPAAENVRAGLDKLTLIAQEHQEELGRTLSAPVGFIPPSGGIARAANTTIGQDENGALESRTPEQQRAHLNIEGEIAAAQQAATQAAAQAATSASEANLDRQGVQEYAQTIANSQNLLLNPAGGFLEQPTTT